MASYAWSGPVFFVNNTATTEIYALSLHDALPIYSNGCSSSCGATLTVNPNPTCSVTPPSATVCAGQTQVFCASAAMASYAWTGPGGFATNTQCITVGVAGTYNVTITDSNGCSSSCGATLTVNSNPTCSITGSSSVCPGSTNTYSGPAGTASYSWSVNHC